MEGGSVEMDLRTLHLMEVAVRRHIIAPMDQLCQYPVIQESTVHVRNFLNQSLTVKQVTIVHLEQRKRNLQME